MYIALWLLSTGAAKCLQYSEHRIAPYKLDYCMGKEVLQGTSFEPLPAIDAMITVYAYHHTGVEHRKRNRAPCSEEG